MNRSILPFTVAVLAFGGVADAQPPTAQSAVAPAAETASANPSRLTGDAPPPSLERMLRLPSGRPTGLAGPPPDRTPSPPWALALEAAQAALDACGADHLLVNVAVVDSLGRLRVVLSADGADPAGVFVAARKAIAAASYGVATSLVQDRLRAGDPATHAGLKSNMIVLPGGVPLLAGGRTIGAIAASGATAQQDEACAAAGAAAIKGKL
jgi:uncharacterized protein GlcG (DUF336 family)